MALPEDAANSHEEPEVCVRQVVEAGDDGQLSEHQHQRDEEGAGVDVVVEGEGPDVALHRGHHLHSHQVSS